MALPNPIPDNPLRWDGWRSYNSPNLYERLCLDPTGNFSADVIEENTRQLLVWWQKKLPLKNQPSNPMAQLLRQGLDDAPQFLAEARTRLLNAEERAKHDAELHVGLVAKAIEEFKKLLTFSISDKTLTEEGEARLYAAGAGMGLKEDDMRPVIDAELERTGSTRVLATPPPPPPHPAAPAPVFAQPVQSTPVEPVAHSGIFQPEGKDPASEFRKLLRMSRLCLDGEEMTDDQRDAMCNLGESLGLTGGQAEDLIDEYLDDAASMPIPASSGPSHSRPVTPSAPVRPAPSPARPASTPARPATPAAQAQVPGRPATVSVRREINLSPVARAEEKQKYQNFANAVGGNMYLIPTGQFRMGCDTPDAQNNEQPVTPVIVTCFYMSRYPITNAMYERFDPTHRNKRAPWADESHPVVYVTSAEAEAFCKWLSQREGRKYRLPTEAEWEYAARGGEQRMFPWGDLAVAGNLANFADARTQFAWRDPSIDDGYSETAPVGSFPRGVSPFGIEDMAGNVFEWTLDSLEPYKGKELVNPKVTKVSTKRVYRGGSWKSRSSSLRCCARNSNVPEYSSNDVGFRIICECE